MHPVRSGAPVHLAQMDQIAGQPHARVIMQIASLVERVHGFVYHGQTGTPLAHIVGQLTLIANARQGGTHIVENAVAGAVPYMMEELAPAEFKGQLVFQTKPGQAFEQGGNADEAVGNVGRKSSDLARQVIAGFFIGPDIDRGYPGLECVVSRGKQVGHDPNCSGQTTYMLRRY